MRNAELGTQNEEALHGCSDYFIEPKMRAAGNCLRSAFGITSFGRVGRGFARPTPPVQALFPCRIRVRSVAGGRGNGKGAEDGEHFALLLKRCEAPLHLRVFGMALEIDEKD